MLKNNFNLHNFAFCKMFLLTVRRILVGLRLHTENNRNERLETVHSFSINLCYANTANDII